jgi:hypothetical protein
VLHGKSVAAAKGAGAPTCDAVFPTASDWRIVETVVTATGDWYGMLERLPVAGDFFEFWQFQAIGIAHREQILNAITRIWNDFSRSVGCDCSKGLLRARYCSAFRALERVLARLRT